MVSLAWPSWLAQGWSWSLASSLPADSLSLVALLTSAQASLLAAPSSWLAAPVSLLAATSS